MPQITPHSVTVAATAILVTGKGPMTLSLYDPDKLLRRYGCYSEYVPLPLAERLHQFEILVRYAARDGGLALPICIPAVYYAF